MKKNISNLNFFSMSGVLEINFNLSMDFVPQIKTCIMYAMLHVCTMHSYYTCHSKHVNKDYLEPSPIYGHIYSQNVTSVDVLLDKATHSGSGSDGCFYHHEVVGLL